jgi:MipA family protein
MNKKFLSLALSLSCVCFANSIIAQESKASEPNASASGQPLWEVGVGLGALRAPTYIGSNQTAQRVLPLPYFIYRGEILRVDENGVDARLLRGDNYRLDLSLGASLGGNNEKIKLREGMPKLGPSFEIGPRFTLDIARPNKDSLLSLNIPVRAVFEINGGIKNRGFIFEPNVRYTKENIGAGVGVIAQAGLLYGNEKVQQHYYAVAPAFATQARPAYTAKAGVLGTRLSFVAFKDVTPNFSLGGFVRVDLSGNAANRKSALHVKNNGITIGLGGNYSFARSSTLVNW